MDTPSDDTLRELAALVDALASGSERVPAASLVRLGAIAGAGQVTVDFRARAHLGHPLVVWQPPPARPGWWTALTPREQEVASLVADGLSNAAIARRLGLALGTVKDHVHALLRKARLSRRSQVAAALR